MEEDDFDVCPICNGVSTNGFCSTIGCAYCDDEDGLTPDEQIIRDLHNEKQQHAIKFAKWLAQDWMNIWVESKWMWEYMHDRTPETFNKYKEYYTEEELYELYLKDQG